MAVSLKPVAEQVVVITGASSGIGLSAARLFCARGVRGLVLVARNAAALRQVADGLRSQRTRVVTVPADTSRREDLERVAQRAIETFGGFDTWVNDAAVALYGNVERIPIEDQRRLFDVNYWGVVNGSLIAARHLRRRGGAIINLGSVLSERTMVLQTQYSASKHAVKGFTDGLRMELERDAAPIAVTLIKPSSTDTPHTEHARTYLDEEPRLPPPTYDPNLVAQAIVFAAENRRRELTIGFGGWMIGALGQIAPRITDRVMEAAGRRMQTVRRPERSPMRDNLYTARQDGDEYSSLPGKPRRTSVLLATQMHPLAAAAILAGLGAAITALLLPRGLARQRRAAAPARPVRRDRPMTRRLGNGHDEPKFGPGHMGPGRMGRQAGPEKHPQARH